MEYNLYKIVIKLVIVGKIVVVIWFLIFLSFIIKLKNWENKVKNL